MSETKKDHRKRSLSSFLPATASLAMLAFTAPALADGLVTYGQSLCAEAGIAADDCTLLSAGPMPSADAASEASTTEGVGRAKTATLIEHAALICEEQGVPLEDCKALPIAYRGTEEEVLPSPFLTVAPTPPGPAIVYADPTPASPPETGQDPQPLPAGYAHQPVTAAQSGAQAVQQPPPVRYAPPPAPIAEPGVRYVEEPPIIYLPPPPIYAAAPPMPPPRQAIVRPREEMIFMQEPSSDRFRPPETGRFTALADRCRRAVRYSRPPSYRFIDCD